METKIPADSVTGRVCGSRGVVEPPVVPGERHRTQKRPNSKNRLTLFLLLLPLALGQGRNAGAPGALNGGLATPNRPQPSSQPPL